MNVRSTRRLAAACMGGAAAFAIAGFTGLGSVFDYPAILEEPTADILAAYRLHQGAVTAWFLALMAGSALLVPIAFLLGRLAGGRGGRWVAGFGVAAAVVQLVGLSRWVLFVPGISDDALDPGRAAAAHDRFELLHTWLGHAVGETIGYALTAAFTVAVVLTVGRAVAPRWLGTVGLVSAALVATGTLVPLGVDVASLTNFLGYIVWTLWLVALAALLWRTGPVATVRVDGATVARPQAASR